MSGIGEVDKEMCNKTLRNIIRGKCPHVDKVDKLYIQESCATAVHIAAATGNDDAIEDYLANYIDTSSGIFGPNPFMIAVLTKKKGAVNLFHHHPNSSFLDIKQEMIYRK